jgi:hypothetical protein
MHDPPPVANAGLGLDLLGRPGSSDLRPSIVAAAHVGVARPSPRGPADRNQSRAAPRPVVRGMRRSIIFSTLVIGAVALGVAACGSGDDTAGASAAGSSTGSCRSRTSAGATCWPTPPARPCTARPSSRAARSIASTPARRSGTRHPRRRPMPRRRPKALDANFGVVKRPDGQRQLTFDGPPLYTFADEGAGKARGRRLRRRLSGHPLRVEGGPAERRLVVVRLEPQQLWRRL